VAKMTEAAKEMSSLRAQKVRELMMIYERESISPQLMFVAENDSERSRRSFEVIITRCSPIHSPICLCMSTRMRARDIFSFSTTFIRYH